MSNPTLEISEETAETTSSVIESESRAAHTDPKGPTPTESQSQGGQSPASSLRTVYFWFALVGVAALVGIAVALYLWNRRTTPLTKTETPTTSETTSSIALSPEQRAAITVEVVQKRSAHTDVTVAGKIAFNGNRVTPI